MGSIPASRTNQAKGLRPNKAQALFHCRRTPLAELARAIRPVFSPFDGDVVYGLATAARQVEGPRPLAVARFGALAADCLARAVARGVHAAASVGWHKAWSDL